MGEWRGGGRGGQRQGEYVLGQYHSLSMTDRRLRTASVCRLREEYDLLPTIGVAGNA